MTAKNTELAESFTVEANFENLVRAIASLNLQKPIFVKMPNEIGSEESGSLIKIALNQNIRGFVFSNLLKNRQSEKLDREEVEKIKFFRGNFSGRPTFENSNNLITSARKTFGSNIVIIGCGGIFSPQDALVKFRSGADLVQLITGMIFQGPQLIGEICEELATAA
mgnify:FL=1